MRIGCGALRLLVGLAGIGLVAGSGCTTSESFECETDQQCALGELQGVCTDIKHCAYPDEMCDSGYKYPDAAGSLGGMCVPGAVSTGGSSSSTTDASTSSSTDASTSSTSTTSTSTTTSSVGSTGSTGAGSTGPTCSPDGNDDLRTAEPVVIPSCMFDLTSTFDGPGDVDWFSFDDLSGCAMDPADTRINNIGSRVCAYVECADPLAVSCLSGTLDMVDALPGCCTDVLDGQVDVDVAPPCDPSTRIVISIEFDDGAACGGEYTVPIEIY